jgi:hypothetical protein
MRRCAGAAPGAECLHRRGPCVSAFEPSAASQVEQWCEPAAERSGPSAAGRGGDGNENRLSSRDRQHRRGGETVNAADLKSAPQKCGYGFETRPRHRRERLGIRRLGGRDLIARCLGPKWVLGSCTRRCLSALGTTFHGCRSGKRNPSVGMVVAPIGERFDLVQSVPTEEPVFPTRQIPGSLG